MPFYDFWWSSGQIRFQAPESTHGGGIFGSEETSGTLLSLGIPEDSWHMERVYRNMNRSDLIYKSY